MHAFRILTYLRFTQLSESKYFLCLHCWVLEREHRVGSGIGASICPRWQRKLPTIVTSAAWHWAFSFSLCLHPSLVSELSHLWVEEKLFLIHLVSQAYYVWHSGHTSWMTKQVGQMPSGKLSPPGLPSVTTTALIHWLIIRLEVKIL